MFKTIKKFLSLSLLALFAYQHVGATGGGCAGLQIILEPSKTVVTSGETNVFYVTAMNDTGSNITNVKIRIVLPSDSGATGVRSVTATGATVTGGGSSNWVVEWSPGTINDGAESTLNINVTHDTNSSGKTATVTLQRVTSFSPVTTTSFYNADCVQVSQISTSVSVNCPLLSWATESFNGGSSKTLNPGETYSENFSTLSQTDNISMVSTNSGQAGASPASVMRLLEVTAGNLGQVIELRQTDRERHNMDTNLTLYPTAYSQVIFNFDQTIYPLGLNGVTFAIYDIDADGWRDGTIVYGVDVNNNLVKPLTSVSSISVLRTFTHAQAAIYASSAPEPGNYNLSNDDPRGRVTYSFTSPIKQFIIRYFNQQVADGSTQLVYISNLYRGCGTDLEVLVTPMTQSVLPCDNVTYIVTAKNNGNNDASLVKVTGLLPAGLTLVSATPSVAFGPGEGFNAGTGEWMVGTLSRVALAPANQKTLTIVATVNSNVALSSTITSTAVIIGDGDETNPSNNQKVFSIFAGSPCTSLVIGTDVNPPVCFSVPQTVKNCNRIGCFTYLSAGFGLFDRGTNGIFDSTFPVMGDVDLNYGTLTLYKDLIFNNNSQIVNLGNILGNGHLIDLSPSMMVIPSAPHAPTACDNPCVTFSDVKLAMNCNLDITDACITFSGDSLINGRGYVLTLSPTTTLLVAPNSSVMFKDVVVKGVKTASFQLVDNSSTVSFQDTTWVLSSDYTLSKGHFDVVGGEFSLVGCGKTFTYTSTQISTIAANARMTINNGFTFRYAPASGSATDLIQLLASTAELFLKGGTLSASTVGMQLTTGRLLIDRKSLISVDAPGQFSLGAVGTDASKDLDVELLPAAQLKLKGTIVDNSTSGSNICGNAGCEVC